MANWRKTSMPNVWVAHQARCPAFDDEDARCRCTPSWRGRRWNQAKRDSEWQKPVTKDRSEVLSWLAAGKKGAEHVRERASAGRTFESIGDEWIAGVAAGRIGRRKGRGKPYTSSTVRDYERSYRNFLRPGVRANACRRHRRGGVADVGRLPQPRGTLALPHHDPRRSRLRDLRVGDRPQPPARDPESAPPRRAPSERRETTTARRLCSRSRTAARGTLAEGRSPLRDRVLRWPPACRDRPTRVAGGT